MVLTKDEEEEGEISGESAKSSLGSEEAASMQHDAMQSVLGVFDFPAVAEEEEGTVDDDFPELSMPPMFWMDL